eukprot:2984167-Karenia_brevis.AAC.1
MELQGASNRHGNPITTSHHLHLCHHHPAPKWATRRKRHRCAMRGAMGWGATDDITEEDMRQMAQEL